jgi:hypothetical protein
MSDASTIKINPAKKSDLEFDVMIQGVDDTAPPTVRFVITSEAQQCDYSFKCSRIDGEEYKWVAKLPALTQVQESNVPFRVEVIVDGYYFEPAAGTVMLVTDPSVKFQPSVSKPKVTTSFTVKQDDDKPAEPKKPAKVKEAVEEAVTLPEIVDPVIETPAPVEEIVMEQPIEIVPPAVEEAFNPSTIAQNIVRSTIGKSIERPATRGQLFKRSQDGKAVVAGIESPADKAAKRAKEARVKEILGSN